jgi:uncharacterized NAD(P)/FAD-binding protein YdhS
MISTVPLDNQITIAIIGGGFSGCLTAVNLVRKHTSSSLLKIILIERSERIAKGVAYGTLCPLHLLNVPAHDMSALSDVSDDFLKWAKRKDSSVTESTFVPRMHYGEYIEWLLNETIATLPPTVQFIRLTGEVRSISIADGAERANLELAGQADAVSADRVVLALGNLAPANVRIENQDFYKSRRYVRDSWVKSSLSDLNPQSSILLIGTGLTMIDKALELRSKGHKGTIHALSRHGLMPNVHLPSLPPSPIPINPLPLPKTAVDALALVRRLISDAESSGANWRHVIDAFRPLTQEIWQLWNESERRRFIRHVRCFWDVHRHGVAPGVGTIIDTMLKDGQLRIHAARLISMNEQEEGVDVTFRRRGKAEKEHFIVDRVINCTGADSNVKTIAEPLVAQLREHGLLCSDALGLGPRVTNEWALIDVNGEASHVLYAVGPLLKGLLWESIAVPELRVQAAQLAEHLIKSTDAVLTS